MKNTLRNVFVTAGGIILFYYLQRLLCFLFFVKIGGSNPLNDYDTPPIWSSGVFGFAMINAIAYLLWGKLMIRFLTQFRFSILYSGMVGILIVLSTWNLSAPTTRPALNFVSCFAASILSCYIYGPRFLYRDFKKRHPKEEHKDKADSKGPPSDWWKNQIS